MASNGAKSHPLPGANGAAFGIALRDARRAARLTLRKLGARLEISATFINDIEFGRRHPSDEVFAGLTQEFPALARFRCKACGRPDFREGVRETMRAKYGRQLRAMQP